MTQVKFNGKNYKLTRRETMFYQKVDKRSNKSMYEFLVNHETYFTMNGWNGLKSIANNVKLYNLYLPDKDKPYDFIQTDDFYMNLNFRIEDFMQEHKGHSVFFNGRSNGYLVLGNKENNSGVLPEVFYHFDKYSSFESCALDTGYDKQSLKKELIYYVDLVSDFDKLTDDMREYLISLCEECDVTDEEYTVTKTRKVITDKEK